MGGEIVYGVMVWVIGLGLESSREYSVFSLAVFIGYLGHLAFYKTEFKAKFITANSIIFIGSLLSYLNNTPFMTLFSLFLQVASISTLLSISNSEKTILSTDVSPLSIAAFTSLTQIIPLTPYFQLIFSVIALISSYWLKSNKY